MFKTYPLISELMNSQLDLTKCALSNRLIKHIMSYISWSKMLRAWLPQSTANFRISLLRSGSCSFGHWWCLWRSSFVTSTTTRRCASLWIINTRRMVLRISSWVTSGIAISLSGGFCTSYTISAYRSCSLIIVSCRVCAILFPRQKVGRHLNQLWHYH